MPLPATSALTLENIESEILSELGGHALDVEVSKSDVLKVVKDALRLYSRWVPATRRASIAVAEAKKKYGPLDVTHKGLLGITSVQFVTQQNITREIDIFDPYYNLMGGVVSPHTTFADIEQGRGYAESAQRIVSAEPDWYAEWEAGEYYLYIDVHRTPIWVSYTYATRYTPDTDVVTSMQYIPFADEDWIIDYVTAKAKVIAGRKRSKFGGIPEPDGGTSETDGAVLIQEGREDEARLREEIERRSTPTLPVLE